MAFKLTKTEIKTVNELVVKLTEQRTAILEAQTAYNHAQNALYEEFAIDLEKYKSLVAEAKKFRNDLLERLQAEYENKSERRQEGDNGTSVAAMIEAWEDIDLEEPRFDEPEPLDYDEDLFSHSESIEDAPADGTD